MEKLIRWALKIEAEKSKMTPEEKVRLLLRILSDYLKSHLG